MKLDIYSFMFGVLLTIFSTVTGAAIALIFAVVV